jgi:hypothetical protein
MGVGSMYGGRDRRRAWVDPGIAKALNHEIRHLADLLPGSDDPTHKYGFSCEDGCEAIVPLTVAEYDAAGGAWLEGHEPNSPEEDG